MATAAYDRTLASERIAPGMLPPVLGSSDRVATDTQSTLTPAG